MHTKTITIHALDNCGSGLQAYALQQYLFSKAIDNEIIDYRPWYIHNNGRPLDWKFFIKRIVFGKGVRERRTIYDRFIRDYLKTTEKVYTSFEQLKNADLQADCFIAGSDQIWNSYFECGKDSSYYLDFVSNQKKFAYAASLGRTEFDDYKMERFMKKTRAFDFVTVREKSAINVLNQIDVDAEQVCDPTLLLNAEEYIKNENVLIEGDYILIYLTQASELLEKAIERLKVKYKNAKVVYVGSFLNRCKCDVNLTNVGPWEFIGLINHAKYVIAGSFHASVFSCILKKSFAVLPYENNIRMEELLNALNLTNRFIWDESYLPVLEYEIDVEEFEKIHRHIDIWRENADKCFFNKLNALKGDKDAE